MKKFLSVLIILILVLIGIIIYFKPSDEAENENEIQQEQIEKQALDSLFEDKEFKSEEDSVFSV